MSVTTTPAPARTDVATTGSSATSDTTTRRLALGLAAGAATWSAVSFTLGFNPESSLGIAITDVGGFAFQLGVLALVTLQLRTRATGVSRKAVAMLQVERVLLGLAMLWSLLHGLVPPVRDDAWLAVLDVFWPLSMLGMFVIGIKVAAAGRWRGAARVWPLVAESWAVVCIPVMGIFGAGVGDVVGAAHLLVGYTTLGVILALRPELTRAPAQR